jgi:soluble lytic murein transglycosylase-like protein
MTMPQLGLGPLNSLVSIAQSPFSFPAIPRVVAHRPPGDVGTGRRMLWCSVVALILSISGSNACAEPVGTAPGAKFSADSSIAAFVDEAAQRFGIPASWIRAVMQAESAGDTRAVSPKGAMGLMQIMPQTWADLRSRYGLGADPYDPHDNILAGAAYLRELHDHYGEPGFLAAYNAGPTRYDDHLSTGRPLPAETQAYLAIVAPQIGGGSADGTIAAHAQTGSWTGAPLFVGHAGTGAADRGTKDATGLAPQPAGLFVSIQPTPRRAP